MNTSTRNGTPPPLPAGGKRDQPTPILLADYLETTFIPAVTRSKVYLTAMRRAVHLFGEFAGDRFIGQIDGDMLRAFAQYLCVDGYLQRSASDYQLRIALLVRHYSEGSVSDLRTRPKINLPDLDWNDKTLLRVVFEDRYRPERISTRSDQTRKHYRLALENLDAFLGWSACLADLTDQNVAGMMAWLVETGRSPRTANNRRDYLLTFWRWCARKKLVDEWPDVDPLKIPDTMPSTWSREQLTQLLYACANQTGRIGGVEASFWWVAMHLFLWDSGERTGALLKLEWQHFDATSSTMYVPGDVRKTGKQALYDLKPKTVAAFEAIRPPERRLIFEMPFCLGSFYNRYTKLLKLAGLTHGRHDKPQKMRRSFASHLEAAGGNATEALQHSNRSMTVNSYLDQRVVKRESPNKLLFDIEANGNGKPAGDGEESGNGKGASE